MTSDAMPAELAAAFVAACGQLVDIDKGRTADAGQYRYRYADLASVLEQVRPVLAAHGLAITQPVETEPADRAVAVSVTTAVVHTTGAVYRSPPLRLTAPPDPQKVGSAITYARRYSLMATLGIAAADDDDDGATARPPAPAKRRAPAARSDDEAEARRLLAELDPDRRDHVHAGFVERFGCKLAELPVERHPEALRVIVDLIAELDDQAALRADADAAHDQDTAP